MSNFVEALKEMYGVVLNGKDEAKYNLIKRYESKVSKRLLEEKKLLRAKGETQAKEMFRPMVNSKPWYMDLRPKPSGFFFIGGPFPVPLRDDQ